MILLAALALQAAEPAPQIVEYDVNGFRARIEVMIEAPRVEVFEAATGDVSPWWDHTFWPERPAELVIEPIFGGVFYERFEEGKDDGVIHASITGVMAPQMLRLDGPLGLAGRGYQLVTTWTLEEAGQGEGTRFIVDLSMIGEVDVELAGIVRSVWVHFIEGRLKPYVEADCHLAPDSPCAAFAAE
jgi:uncharacterized protein YndB with AHSA1/START domain